MRRLVLVPVALALLAGCDVRIGNDVGTAVRNEGAAGKTENGQLTIEAPGFNLSVTVPEGMTEQANIESRDGLVYPGATIAGVHVQGGREAHGGHGEVEIRLTSGDAPDRILAWYRDPARADQFTIATTARDGDATLLGGTGRRDGERFSLRIAPRAGGGSDMRLLLSDAG